MEDWWIIVTNAGTTNPVCFIMRPKEVRQLARRGEKEGRVSYWLEPTQSDTDQFREAWPQLGRSLSSRFVSVGGDHDDRGRSGVRPIYRICQSRKSGLRPSFA